MLIIITLFLALPAFINSINVTVCDCNKVEKEKVYELTTDCNSFLPKINIPNENILYDYLIYTDRPENIPFKAKLCSRWIDQLIVSRSWLDQEQDKPRRIPIDTSEWECRELIENKNCGKNQMTFKDERWEYIQEAVGPGKWWTDVTYEELNCFLDEEVMLQKNCNQELCTIITPFREINETERYYSHNHNTIVFPDKIDSIKRARLREVKSGVGNLFELWIKEELRLRDSTDQLFFHLNNKTATVENINATEWLVYDVINMKNVYAYVKQQNNTVITKKTNTKTPFAKSQMSWRQDDYVKWNALNQFNSDHETDNENTLQQMIDMLDCQRLKLLHQQAVIVAQNDGWLSAHLLELPICTKVQALGNAIKVFQCIPKTADFTVQTTTCGPQPVCTVNDKNYTISKSAPLFFLSK